ncbi:SDR family oxidoreductase [Ideonella sp. 4Y16]|uniref:SDR family NAD(P)-dependent oxidoreductase n=1 Tax=Ideonella alba TaxID=2824118 RepID=UPI001B385920|nr:SDR family oxidoreductase [Ideonella alba]MBQ0944609.1 SDR family oxidoreductase [Ideonella alba]
MSPATLFDLHGQTALVTGATQGLGWAIAQALAAHGARLLVSDRDAGACARAAAALQDRGHTAVPLPADLANAAQVTALCAQAGAVDVLVCNAGIQGPAGPLAAATDTDWQQVLDINLRAAARLSSGLIPAMAARGRGSVVLMSSIAGLRGNGAIGLYGLSKAAIAQLARNLAVEWGPSGVRVNAVSPGLVRTPLAAGLLADEDFMQRRLQATPLRRVGEPDEIAGVVVMLASAAGGFTTGQNLVVDGGTTISDGS